MNINRAYVRRNVVAGLTPEAARADVDEAIDAAIFTLQNLIHYQAGRSHHDEDVAYLARVLIMRRIET